MATNIELIAAAARREKEREKERERERLDYWWKEG